MMRACFVLNHACNNAIQNIPITAYDSTTCDASPLLHFHSWQKMCRTNEEHVFPETSNEDVGNFVRIRENVGHDMNFNIININANKVINRYINHITGASAPNLHVDLLDPTSASNIVKSISNKDNNSA